MPNPEEDDDMALVAAEFARTPEEEAEAKAECAADLAMIRKGGRPRKGLVNAIHNFGEERYMDALPEIKKYITSTNATLRYIALHVLTFHYELAEYAPVALNMMQHDPDEECRLMAISGLGSLRRGTGDPQALKVLAALVTNENESSLAREKAYAALREIVTTDRQEQRRLAGERVKLDHMDWDFVRRYAEGN